MDLNKITAEDLMVKDLITIGLEDKIALADLMGPNTASKTRPFPASPIRRCQ